MRCICFGKYLNIETKILTHTETEIKLEIGNISEKPLLQQSMVLISEGSLFMYLCSL